MMRTPVMPSASWPGSVQISFVAASRTRGEFKRSRLAGLNQRGAQPRSSTYQSWATEPLLRMLRRTRSPLLTRIS